MLKATKAGRTLVAVGERGHIIRSSDDGKSWRQADRVPTQATLTDVHFINSKKGWAVGHGAIILHTDDGGLTWIRQHANSGAERLLLTIHFFNENHGFAMGDGSLILETKDGGASWKSHTAWRNTYGDFQLSDAFQSPSQDTIYVAADFGALFRFKDTGPTFRLMQTPAQSTFRRGLMLADGTVWLVGARDQLWKSNKNRTSWRRVQTNAGHALNAGAATEDGTLVFAGDNGTVAISFDKGNTFVIAVAPELSDYVDVLSVRDRTLLLLGAAGIAVGEIPSPKDCNLEPVPTAACEIAISETKFVVSD